MKLQLYMPNQWFDKKYVQLFKKEKMRLDGCKFVWLAWRLLKRENLN